MKTPLLAAILLALAPAALAGEEVPPPTPHAMGFHFVVGVEKTKRVTGWFDRTRGEKYDLVVLDLDGDGTAETRIDLPGQSYGVGEDKQVFVRTEFGLDHEGARWQVMILGLNEELPDDPDRPKHLLYWSVTKDEFMAAFGGGAADLGLLAGKRESHPVRLGGPFRFEARARAQGMETVLEVSLKDGTGGSLTAAHRNGESVRPGVVLAQKGERKLATHVEYG